MACLQPCEHERGERRPRAQEWMREGEQSERQQREDDREGSRARGEKVQRGVGGTVTHTDRLCSQLIGRGACQSEELGLGRCLKSRL